MLARYWFLVVLWLMQGGIPMVWAQQRGVPVSIKNEAGKSVISYTESHALLIGVSQYDKGWPALPGVSEDLDSVKAVLEYQKFNSVTVLKNPSKAELTQGMSAFINTYGLQRDKRLVIWVAGHGITHVPTRGDSLGYFVPKDAPVYQRDHDNQRNHDNQGFFEKAIPLTQFDAWASEILASHVLLVFDACFAGNIIEKIRGGPSSMPEAISERLNKPVRLYMTSGSAQETVPDESEFRKGFCAALRGQAGGAEADGYLTGTELGEYLYNRVLNKVGRHPQFGKDKRRADQGDIVFVTVRPAVPPQNRPNLEPWVAQANLETQWSNWQQDMRASFAQVKEIDQGKASAATKQQAWEQFLNGFKVNNPYSNEDETLRGNALGRRDYWATYKSSPVMTNITLPGVIKAGELETYSVTWQGDGVEVLWEMGDGSTGKGSGITHRYARSGRYTIMITLRNVGGVVTERRVVDVVTAGVPNTFTNSIGMKFVKIAAGSFMMGSPESDKDAGSDEKPQHRVTITKDFYVGQYEVTQAEWEAVMGSNPSRFKGANRPVESVSWEEAQAFIQKLNQKEGTSSYRLLTEAEWEYAARAGSTTRYSWGNEIGVNKANCDGCGSRWDNKETAPVGSFAANAWGLYDMHGNVWEWVQDWYQSDYYGKSPSSDPSNLIQNSNTYRVLRGGSWSSKPQYLRAANRDGNHPTYRLIDMGFRLAKTFDSR